jgi:hypothetical protein
MIAKSRNAGFLLSSERWIYSTKDRGATEASIQARALMYRWMLSSEMRRVGRQIRAVTMLRSIVFAVKVELVKQA